jgi:hypothetical protein
MEIPKLRFGNTMIKTAAVLLVCSVLLLFCNKEPSKKLNESKYIEYKDEKSIHVYLNTRALCLSCITYLINGLEDVKIDRNNVYMYYYGPINNFIDDAFLDKNSHATEFKSDFGIIISIVESNSIIYEIKPLPTTHYKIDSLLYKYLEI